MPGVRALIGPLPLLLSSRGGADVQLRLALAEIEIGYWFFTRSARGRPVDPYWYNAKAWAREALRRMA